MSPQILNTIRPRSHAACHKNVTVMSLASIAARLYVFESYAATDKRPVAVTKFHSDGPVIHVSGQLWSIFNQSYERMSTIKVSMERVLIPTVTQSMYGQMIDGRWIDKDKNKVEKDKLICNSSLIMVPIPVNKYLSVIFNSHNVHIFCQIKDT